MPDPAMRWHGFASLDAGPWQHVVSAVSRRDYERLLRECSNK